MSGELLTQAEVLPHIDRFMGFVERQENGCWFRFSRARNSGYTTITANGRSLGAHRFAYAAFNGDIPAGMEVDHKCRDRGCVNPEHLELVTRQENLKRRDSFTPNDFTVANLMQRIETRVIKQENGCWYWTGALVRGYGVISIDGRTNYVHRVYFEEVKGKIQESYDLDHLCRTPMCVNPDHLEPVTRSENVARMLNKQPKDKCRRGHKYETVGLTSRGTCISCWEITNGKKYVPPKPPRPEHLCANGHDITEVGRYKTGGCRACQAEKDAARGQRSNAVITRFCDEGHDLAEVGKHGNTCQTCWDEGWCANGHDMNIVGRTSKGACRECKKDRSVKFAEQRTGECNAGHNLQEMGVNPTNGECRQCAREYAAKRYGYTRTKADLEDGCKNGHPWSEENTRFTKRNRNGVVTVEKVCKTCANKRSSDYHSRKTVT